MGERAASVLRFRAGWLGIGTTGVRREPMMSTDYQFHRPMDWERRVAEIERIAVARDDQRMRTAVFVVAANVVGLVLLILLTA